MESPRLGHVSAITQNKIGAREGEYRKGATKFAHSGKLAAGAKEAERAVDEDSEELQLAVDVSRKPSAGDLKQDLEKAAPKRNK